MKWQDIDNIFRCYERLCRKPPTTEELVDGILAGREVVREILEKYKVVDKDDI